VSVMLIEEPMLDRDDSASSNDFDDFADLSEGSHLGLREEPGSLQDYLCSRRGRVVVFEIPITIYIKEKQTNKYIKKKKKKTSLC